MPLHRSARSARAIVAVLIVSAFALGSASSATAAPLACGDVITSPGVYTLTGNLNCSAMPPAPRALGVASGAEPKRRPRDQLPGPFRRYLRMATGDV
jgi:hypothetical protein